MKLKLISQNETEHGTSRVFTNVQTNGDRIRSMTDEELARILAEGCHGTIECPNCCGEYTETIKSCTECWLDWLEEEVSK